MDITKYTASYRPSVYGTKTVNARKSCKHQYNMLKWMPFSSGKPNERVDPLSKNILNM